RLDAALRRHHLGNRPLPFGANFVAIIPSTVHPSIDGLSRRHRRVLGKLAVFLQETCQLLIHLFLALCVQQFLLQQEGLVQRNGVALLPIFTLFFRNIFGRIVLRVPAPPERLRLNQNRPLARPCAFHRLFGYGVHLCHVV